MELSKWVSDNSGKEFRKSREEVTCANKKKKEKLWQSTKCIIEYAKDFSHFWVLNHVQLRW